MGNTPKIKWSKRHIYRYFETNLRGRIGTYARIGEIKNE